MAFAVLILWAVSPMKVIRPLHEWSSFLPSLSSLFASDSEKYKNASHAAYQHISWIHNNTPEESLFLVFRWTDFAYYGNRKYIRDEDPRMHPVYKATSVEEVFIELKNLSVDYIVLPYFQYPTFYKTKLAELLANPEYTQLLVDLEYHRVFRLKQQEIRISSEVLKAEFKQYGDGELTSSYDKHPSFELTKKTRGTSEIYFDTPVVAEAEYKIGTAVKGKGFFSLQVYFKNEEDRVLGGATYWESALENDAKIFNDVKSWDDIKFYRPIATRFLTPKDTHHITLFFRLTGRGQLSADAIRLTRFEPISMDAP